MRCKVSKLYFHPVGILVIVVIVVIVVIGGDWRLEDRSLFCFILLFDVKRKM